MAKNKGRLGPHKNDLMGGPHGKSDPWRKLGPKWNLGPPVVPFDPLFLGRVPLLK